VSDVETEPQARGGLSIAATRLGAWILVICWGLAILTLVMQPGAEELGRRRLRIDVTSLGHAAYFAALALLVGNGLLRHGVRRIRWWTVVAVVLFGILCEVIQLSVPGRTPSVADLVADVAGAAAGAVGFGIVAGRLRALDGPRNEPPAPPAVADPTQRPVDAPPDSRLWATRDHP
jgi:hypothetical protein